MEYSVESFSSDSVDIKTFSNVALTKGKTMYSELRASTPANEIRLQLINTINIPITEIQPDAAEIVALNKKKRGDGYESVPSLF